MSDDARSPSSPGILHRPSSTPRTDSPASRAPSLGHAERAGLPPPDQSMKDKDAAGHRQPTQPSERAMATGSDGVQDVHGTAGGASPGQRQHPDTTTTTNKNSASESTPANPSSLSGLPGARADQSAAAAAAGGDGSGAQSPLARLRETIVTFAKFIGPGFMIAVAYIDPGNYSTDVAAGASYRFRLLFVVLLSNLFAILLQGLSLKLGSVTGLDLAEACRAFLPRWLNYFLYVLAEVAIIATDLAEVIGTAIAINLLIPQVPLIAGCAISIVDVMILLLFYRPNGSMKGLRSFEYFVVALVLAVVVCFCIQMSLIEDTPVGDVFRGYLPSSVIIEQQALYQACGILGATVMPHSLYLGSGTVQPRLKEYDRKMGFLTPDYMQDEKEQGGTDKVVYVPSLAAIKHCIKYSFTELVVSLFTFALFINSSILIVAGASLYGSEEAQNDDIFAIHDLLTQSLGKGAGVLFALALLLSGVSAGLVCTIAGQMVSEGALAWRMPPWARRLVTRSISITPAIVIAGGVGRDGLDTALNASQVVLSAVLPFVSAPLIYFTCLSRYMRVQKGRAEAPLVVAIEDDEEDDDNGEREGEGDVRRVVPTRSTRISGATMSTGQHRNQNRNRNENDAPQQRSSRNSGIGGVGVGVVGSSSGGAEEYVSMRNSLPVAILAVLVWLIITAMNVANLVLLGLGED